METEILSHSGLIVVVATLIFNIGIFVAITRSSSRNVEKLVEKFEKFDDTLKTMQIDDARQQAKLEILGDTINKMDSRLMKMEQNNKGYSND